MDVFGCEGPGVGESPNSPMTAAIQARQHQVQSTANGGETETPGSPMTKAIKARNQAASAVSAVAAAVAAEDASPGSPMSAAIQARRQRPQVFGTAIPKAAAPGRPQLADTRHAVGAPPQLPAAAAFHASDLAGRPKAVGISQVEMDAIANMPDEDSDGEDALYQHFGVAPPRFPEAPQGLQMPQAPLVNPQDGLATQQTQQIEQQLALLAKLEQDTRRTLQEQQQQQAALRERLRALQLQTQQQPQAHLLAQQQLQQQQLQQQFRQQQQQQQMQKHLQQQQQQQMLMQQHQRQPQHFHQAGPADVAGSNAFQAAPPAEDGESSPQAKWMRQMRRMGAGGSKGGAAATSAPSLGFQPSGACAPSSSALQQHFAPENDGESSPQATALRDHRRHHALSGAGYSMDGGPCGPLASDSCLSVSSGIPSSAPALARQRGSASFSPQLSSPPLLSPPPEEAGSGDQSPQAKHLLRKKRHGQAAQRGLAAAPDLAQQQLHLQHMQRLQQQQQPHYPAQGAQASPFMAEANQIYASWMQEMQPEKRGVAGVPRMQAPAGYGGVVDDFGRTSALDGSFEELEDNMEYALPTFIEMSKDKSMSQQARARRARAQMGGGGYAPGVMA
eukprot:TRINITY_DN4767_c0_g6_i3.p1 TRINITY_DN4767_c0_g6~~TRINITY_DN4767_c0_g6_i3.p1  ORF type:complete len:652 (-),score=167.88 TRINITY_DN4767_c0_g6_i3:296-2146(-)